MLQPDQYDHLGDMFFELMPTYKSRTWKNFAVTFKWDPAVAEFIRSVSPRRCDKRIASYVIPGELERSKTAMRFGVAKTGHGYHGERGDFCLVGGSLEKGHLHLFYRRVELLGGLHYDLAIMSEIERVKGPLKKVTILAAGANAFCLKANSNEKLYKKLRSYYLGKS